jgi:signal peptide peptidase SppA
MKTVPQLLSEPMLILPQKASTMLEAWQRLGLERHSNELVRLRPLAEVLGERAPPDPLAFSIEAADRGDRKPYQVVQGVAVIDIKGVLMHEVSFWGWLFGDEMGYPTIREALMIAKADPEVRGIALDVNSPGGMVSGCFDLADTMYEMRDEKPVWAIIDESCYSAAYALASTADRIILPRTGGIGSVGVITMHVDITKALDEMGVKVTTIQYGKRKSDSYPTTPLSKDARERMQAEIDVLGQMFVDLVARNRGIDASTVRETEAGCFLGEAGVEVGFADAVMPVDQAISELIEEVN